MGRTSCRLVTSMTSPRSGFRMTSVLKEEFDSEAWLEMWKNSPYWEWFQRHRKSGWKAATPDTDPYEFDNGRILIIDFEDII